MSNNGGGIVKNFDSRTYSVNDFVEWHTRSQLELSPKFQRRAVWSIQAKSYLIDTILKGKPIPKIFIRSTTDPTTKITVREVVDGQQRLRAILNYIADGFRISRIHNKEYGGLLFSELPDNVQRDFLNYELSVDLLIDLADKDVLDIFARLNAYSVKLNRQELLNAEFFGVFKTLVYDLCYEYTTFWTENGIFTNNSIMRMQEASLVSDIIATITENEIVDSKKMERIYKKYDETFECADRVKESFISIMDYIGTLFGSGNLKDSEFTRQPLFYSLFICIYHMNFGLSGLESARKSVTSKDIPKVLSFIGFINEIVENPDDNVKFQPFIKSVLKTTTDPKVRTTRTKFLCDTLLTFLE